MHPQGYAAFFDEFIQRRGIRRVFDFSGITRQQGFHSAHDARRSLSFADSLFPVRLSTNAAIRGEAWQCLPPGCCRSAFNKPIVRHRLFRRLHGCAGVRPQAEIRPQTAAKKSELSDLNRFVFQRDHIAGMRFISYRHQHIGNGVIVKLMVARHVDHGFIRGNSPSPIDAIAATANIPG